MATKKYLDLDGLTLYDGKIKNKIPKVYYGVCNTEETTKDKVVVCPNFVLEEGASIKVSFKKAEGTSSLSTLNVNNTGAIGIYLRHSSSISSHAGGMWQDGEVVDFVYDGTGWVIVKGGTATENNYGLVKLNTSINSTSTTTASTSSAVKQAYDLADSKQEELVSGTNIKTINNQSLLGSGNISISGGLTIDDIYPVGSIYMSVNSTSPATLFGGTWQRIKDTFLLASGDTYTSGSTGGSANAVLVEHTHETTSNGEHTHPIKYKANGVITGSTWRPVTTSQDGTSSSYMSSSGGHSHTISTEGESGTGKNMPPYLAVYMWQRTA